MKHLLALFALPAFLYAAAPAATRQAIGVATLDGSARVQHISKKNWVGIAAGARLGDNDMVETYFQSRLGLRFGSGNSAVLGPNARALFNIRNREDDNGAPILEMNITLFSGSCLVKAALGCRISVFTPDAGAETRSGAFSATVDAKTGESGIQTLGGSAKVRNISRKEEVVLLPGQTTMVFPGKEPSVPSAVTARRVNELARLFGEERVATELGAAGVRPVQEKNAVIAPSPGGTEGYRQQFGENRIWGSILTDRGKEELAFSPFVAPDVSSEHMVVVQESNDLALAGGRMFQSFSLVPSYSSPFFGAGLRISLAANHTGVMGMYGVHSLAGYLDFIDHVTVGPFFDSTFVKLGPVENYTLGDGLVVDGYRNYNPYSLFHPLGLTGQVQAGDVDVKAFVGDIAALSPGGAYVSYRPERFHLGAGFFFDRDMEYVEKADQAGFRFVNIPRAGAGTVRLDPSSKAYVYQADFSGAAISTWDLYLAFGMAFAQKIASNRTDGFLLRVPSVDARWNAVCLKLNLTIESGRIVEGEFDRNYMGNRERLINTAAIPDTLVTPNSVLNTGRLGTKLELFYGMNPVQGLSFSLGYKQNIFDNRVFLTDTAYHDPDLSLGLNLSINDSLWRAIRYGTLYVEEVHGGLFPKGTVFPAWGLRAGFDVITSPIIFGVGLCGGLSWYYLDMNANDRIDSGDGVLEFYLGLRYGFL
jgi:hypothetical protein